MRGGEARTQRLGCRRSRMEEAELSLERRPGAGPPAPPPGVEVSTAGLLAVRSSRLPLVPPLDFRELFRLETRFRFSMSESRMGAGVPPPPPPPVPELLCGDSRDSRDRDRRITANDDLSNLPGIQQCWGSVTCWCGYGSAPLTKGSGFN
jgi:hypothetical protein